MRRRKIFSRGIVAVLALLVVPVAANAAPEPPAPAFIEPRFSAACYNADDLDADLIDNADPDTVDTVIGTPITASGTVDTSATSVDLFEIPPSPAPPIFIGTDLTVAGGTWSITMTLAQQTEGYHLLHAFAKNGLGVGTSLAGARVFCVDTMAPAAPTFNVIDPTPSDFTNCVTNPFVMSGRGEPNATVFVEEQPPGPGQSFWFTRVDSSGAWTINAHHDDLAGNHTVTVLVFQRDGGRNQSASIGASFDVCDDVTPPPAPVITSPSSGGLPSGAVLTITGTVVFEPGIRVFVREFSTSPDFFADFEATVEPTGDWTLTQTFPSSGIVTMNAYAVDLAGNMSALSNTVIKMIDVNAPQVRINLPSGFLLADLWIFSDPSFSGTAKDNYGLDHIEITYTPTLMGTAHSTNPATCIDSDGACPTDFDDVADPNDTFEPPEATWSDAPPLAPGLYTMRVLAVDLAGNRSAPDTMNVLIVNLP